MLPIRIGICLLQPVGVGGRVKEIMALTEHLAQRFSVSLITDQLVDWEQRQRFFGVDLSKVNLVYLRPLPQWCQLRSGLAERWQKRFYPLATLRYYMHQIRALHLDLFIMGSPTITMPPLAKRSIYMCTFPRHIPSPNPNPHLASGQRIKSTLNHWLQQAVVGVAGHHILADYDVITANSCYTQYWIQQRWGLPATVVYSACELITGTAPKEKIICHVGRFTAHAAERPAGKRQDLAIETFKTLTDLHQAGWQLHLAGGMRDLNAEHEQYLARLKAMAHGYPIFFHVNAPLAELHDLYRRASIYWHAQGYGLDLQCHPEQHEHFGITTVEAMSAGAVPVVINSAGPAEVVEPGVNGFVWNQPVELTAYTRQLAQDPALWQTMSQQAIARSQQLGKGHFGAQMDAIVDSLLADRRGNR